MESPVVGVVVALGAAVGFVFWGGAAGLFDFEASASCFEDGGALEADWTGTATLATEGLPN